MKKGLPFILAIAVALGLAGVSPVSAQFFPPVPPPGGGLTERDVSSTRQSVEFNFFDPFFGFIGLTAEHIDFQVVTPTSASSDTRWTVSGCAPFVGCFSQDVPDEAINIDVGGGTARVDTLIEQRFFFPPRLITIQVSCTAIGPVSESRSDSTFTDPITGLTSDSRSETTFRQAACVGEVSGFRFNTSTASISETETQERVR